MEPSSWRQMPGGERRGLSRGWRESMRLLERTNSNNSILKCRTISAHSCWNNCIASFSQVSLCVWPWTHLYAVPAFSWPLLFSSFLLQLFRRLGSADHIWFSWQTSFRYHFNSYIPFPFKKKSTTGSIQALPHPHPQFSSDLQSFSNPPSLTTLLQLILELIHPRSSQSSSLFSSALSQ